MAPKQQKRKVSEEVDGSSAPPILESKPKKGKTNVITTASNDNPIDIIDGNGGNGNNHLVIIEHCKSW
jgi:hypothetical protein